MGPEIAVRIADVDQRAAAAVDSQFAARGHMADAR